MSHEHIYEKIPGLLDMVRCAICGYVGLMPKVFQEVKDEV